MESRLINSIKNGDSAAFSYLYKSYSQALFTVIYDKIRCYHTSKDLLQDVFIRIHEKFEQYDPARGRLYTWMLSITKHRITDYLRSAVYKMRAMSSETNGDIAIHRSVDAIGITRFLFKLDKKYQPIMKLAFYEGYSQVEISKELEIPLGTVKTRMRTALSILRSYCFDRVSGKSGDTLLEAV